MPTAAKLIGALSFAFLSWVVCIIVEGVMPADQRVGYLYPVSVVAGAVAGWFVSGSAKRTSHFEAASTGVRTAATAVLLALFTFAVARMWTIASYGRYRGPLEAVLDIVNQFTNYAIMLVATPVIVALFVGGALCGMLTEAAGRRWR